MLQFLLEEYHQSVYYEKGDTLNNLLSQNHVLQGIISGASVNGEKLSDNEVIRDLKDIKFEYNYEEKYIKSHFEFFGRVVSGQCDLRMVERQTNELCLHSIMSDVFSIEYVKNQTLEQLDSYPLTLEGIKNKTKNLSLVAVLRDPDSIVKIRNPSFALLQIAAIKGGHPLGHISEKFYSGRDSCLEMQILSHLASSRLDKELEYSPIKIISKNFEVAMLNVKSNNKPQFESLKGLVRRNGLLLEEVIKQFYVGREFCEEVGILSELAISENGMALQFVPDKTPRLCEMAVSKNGWSVFFVENPGKDLIMAAISQNGSVLSEIGQERQTEEMCLIAVRQYAWAYKFAKFKTDALRRVAIETCPIIEREIKKY